MKNRITVILFSIVNLSAAIILLLDGFVNKGFNSERIVVQKQIEKTSSKGSSHKTNILVDNLGSRYNVPDYVYNEVSLGDSIYIRSSIIFNRPNLFDYSINGEAKTIRVGILNTSVIGVLLCLCSCILYLLLLIKPSMFGEAEQHSQIALFGSWLVIIVGAFHYFFQP